VFYIVQSSQLAASFIINDLLTYLLTK